VLVLVALARAQIPAGFPTPLQLCKWNGTVYRGSYEDSGLFLGTHSKDRNLPDLLFYSTSGRPDNYPIFRLATAGMDTGLAFDLGPVPLNRVNYYNVTKPPPDGSPEQIWVIPGHTIAVWTFHQEIQALWAFHVHAFDGYSVALEYTVHFYQYVQQSNYVIGNYDAHPTQDCSAPNPLPKPLQTCQRKFAGPYVGNFTDSALFLSVASQTSNLPELLFVSQDGQTQTFQLDTSGIDTGAVVSLGSAPLSTINMYNVTRPETPFQTQRIDTVVGNSYGIWTFHQAYQALWAFSVDACVGQACSISYTVIYYQVVSESDYVIAPDFHAFPQPVCTPVF